MSARQTKEALGDAVEREGGKTTAESRKRGRPMKTDRKAKVGRENCGKNDTDTDPLETERTNPGGTVLTLVLSAREKVRQNTDLWKTKTDLRENIVYQDTKPAFGNPAVRLGTKPGQSAAKAEQAPSTPPKNKKQKNSIL